MRSPRRLRASTTYNQSLLSSFLSSLYPSFPLIILPFHSSSFFSSHPFPLLILPFLLLILPFPLFILPFYSSSFLSSLPSFPLFFLLFLSSHSHLHLPRLLRRTPDQSYRLIKSDRPITCLDKSYRIIASYSYCLSQS